MDQETLWHQFSTLPPSAREEITDFIAFLHTKYMRTSIRNRALPPLSHDPFLGIWQDRTEMEDATAWVRTFRTQEWQ